MTDPSEAEIRQTLRDAGVDVGKRGRLSADQHAAYQSIVAAGASSGDDFWDDPGTPGSGFATGNEAPPPPAGPGPRPDDSDGPPPAAVPLEAEQAPRPVKGPSAASRIRDGVRARLAGSGPQQAKGKPRAAQQGSRPRRPRGRPAQPWRSTAGVIEEAYRRLAMSAGGIPPLQRILAAQAPAAGVVLEAQLRGTLADRVLLQPAARLEERGDAVLGMVGMPVMTAWIALHGRIATQQTPEGPAPVFDEHGMPVWEPGTAAAIAGLKYCALSWLKVSSRNAEQIAARADEMIAMDSEADRLVMWIITGTMPDPAPPGGEQGAAAPPPPGGAADGNGQGPASSSAFRPAISVSVLGDQRL